MTEKLERQAAELIRENGWIPENSRVLVACSGGPDSVALLHVMKRIGETTGFTVGAAHVDHMLRGEESAEDARFVRAMCAGLGVPFHGTAIPVGDIVRREGGNVQDVCRVERYRYFGEIMIREGYHVLATAHHADDVMETVLMRLSRGTADAAPGIPASRKFGKGLLVRPFLLSERREVMEYLEAHGLPSRLDPSNLKPDYTRNRFRHRIVPLIREENPGAARRIAEWDLARREDEAYLAGRALEIWEKISEPLPDGGLAVETEAFSRVPSALQRRLIPILLDYLYLSDRHPSGARLESLILSQLTRTEGSGSVDLPDGCRLEREYGRAIFRKTGPDESGSAGETRLPAGRWVTAGEGVRLFWSDRKMVPEPESAPGREVLYFGEEAAMPPLSVRTPQAGDRILLPNMAEPKKVSRIFIDGKIPRSRRASWPVVTAADGRIVAVPGVRYGRGFTRDGRAGGPYIFIVEQAPEAKRGGHAQEETT
ncbi:tRNA lysidine(34) synthetase TilS [Bhargavaea beijingensis]|nr:tRNA lysidine(34) synthetase TilS [Bhargavaea beijingensis]SDE77375.1 bifunctional protein TilS/HprT [Bhargavaea beijingensis]